MNARLSFFCRVLFLIGQLLSGSASAAPPQAAVPPPQPLVLKAEAFRHYLDALNQNDNELYVQHIPNAAAWEFLKNNIPLLDCPDKDIEEIYYFRWWTFRKAVQQTPDGFIITEFLPNVGWAGKHNSINCAAGHHLHEGRWLNDPKYLDDYSLFWFRKGGSPRSYSFWAADSLWSRSLVNGDDRLPKELLPDLIANYEAWENHAPRCQRTVLADRRPRRHGDVDRRQRISGDDQRLHVRRCPGHCQDRRAVRPQ